MTADREFHDCGNISDTLNHEWSANLCVAFKWSADGDDWAPRPTKVEPTGKAALWLRAGEPPTRESRELMLAQLRQ